MQGGRVPVLWGLSLVLTGLFSPLMAVPTPVPTAPEIAAQGSSSAPQPRAAACLDNAAADENSEIDAVGYPVRIGW